jgi:DNA-binding SARP family transcriptional activator
LLALQESALGRSTTAGMPWPDVTERRARSCLRSALLRLPPLARPVVRVTPDPVDLRAGQALARRLLDPAVQPAEDDLAEPLRAPSRRGFVRDNFFDFLNGPW